MAEEKHSYGPLKVVQVLDPAQFEEVLQAEHNGRDGSTPLFVHVYGGTDPATGKSWCPDCVQAHPVIEKVLGALPKGVVIDCPVAREGYKGNPNHPYRRHAQLQLKAVPTLYKWPAKGSKQAPRSLVEEQLFEAENIEALIEWAEPLETN